VDGYGGLLVGERRLVLGGCDMLTRGNRFECFITACSHEVCYGFCHSYCQDRIGSNELDILCASDQLSFYGSDFY
jgi:hypothetical protein